MRPVDEIIIRPLKDFSPPSSLRGNSQGQERLLDTYCKGLEEFDPITLRKAWQRVVNTHRYWCWPTLQEIRAAAEEVVNETQPKGQMGNKGNDAGGDQIAGRWLWTGIAAVCRSNGVGSGADDLQAGRRGL